MSVDYRAGGHPYGIPEGATWLSNWADILFARVCSLGQDGVLLFQRADLAQT